MNPKRPLIPRDEAGFTLIELLVSSALGLMVVGGFLAFSRFQLFAMQDQSKQLDLQTTVRNTAQLFADEVRRAGADPLCTKSFDGITAASNSYIYVRADLDGSGSIGGQSEDVFYFFSDEADVFYRYSQGKLERLVSGTDIGGTRIRYFNSAGFEINAGGGLSSAERAAVRRVRLELKMKDKATDPNRAQRVVAEATTDVDLRNRFFLGSTMCP